MKAGMKTRYITDDFGIRMAFRRCSSCQRWKAQALGVFSPVRKDPGSRRITGWDAWCLECRSVKQVARWANMSAEARREESRARWERMQNDPVMLLDRRAANAHAQRKYREKNLEETRRQQRLYYERMKADPVRYAAYLETRRIEHRLRREQRDGTHVGDVRKGALSVQRQKVKGHVWTLPARPLGDRLMEEARDLAGSELHDEGISAVCLRAGIAVRNLFGWVNGERAAVQFDVADRVLTSMGWLWFDVWGEDPVARRAFEGDEEAVA